MTVIVFLILCTVFAVAGIVWLYRIAQGKERRAPDKRLTDALQKLKEQGRAAAGKHHNKDR